MPSWLSLLLTALGMVGTLLLGVDRWVHSKDTADRNLLAAVRRLDADLSKRMDEIDRRLTGFINSQSDKANILQKFVGNTEIRIALQDERLKHLRAEVAELSRRVAKRSDDPQNFGKERV